MNRIEQDISLGTGFERRLSGLAVGSGIAVGPVFGTIEVPTTITWHRIAAADVEAERLRLDGAVALSRKQLSKLRARLHVLPGETQAEIVPLLDACLQMLGPSRLPCGAKLRIGEAPRSAEQAVMDETEVDPVWWSFSSFCWVSPECVVPALLTRLKSVGRCLSWSMPAAIPRTWPGSSRRRGVHALGRRRLRRRHVRELSSGPRRRAAEAAPLCLPGRSQDGLPQLHRGLVQPRPAALGAGIALTRGLRGSNKRAPSQNRPKPNPNHHTKTGQLH